MAVSLTKEPRVPEYTPEHIADEEAPMIQLPITKYETQISREQLTKTNNKAPELNPIETRVMNTDLTALSEKQLCDLTKKVTNQMVTLYKSIEKITNEAERRADIDKFWNENYFGDIGYFHENLSTKIAKSFKRYKRRHCLDWMTVDILRTLGSIVFLISVMIICIFGIIKLIA